MKKRILYYISSLFMVISLSVYPAGKFVDSVNSQRFKGIANNNLGGSYNNLGKDVIKAKIKDIMYNSLKDDDLSLGNTGRVVEAFNVLDWYRYRADIRNQNRDMNEMEVKSELRVKFPENMATEETQLKILDKQIESLEYAMKGLQLQTAEWKNSLAQTASNDGAFYKDYMSDLAQKKKELEKIQGNVGNSLASIDNLEKSIKDRFGSYSPNLAPLDLVKDHLGEDYKVLKRMMNRFKEIELNIQADSANYEATVFSERVANANNHIKALQLVAETMGGVHRGLNSLTEIFVEMNMREQVKKMYALEQQKNKQVASIKAIEEQKYFASVGLKNAYESADKILTPEQKARSGQYAQEIKAYNAIANELGNEELRLSGYFDNISRDVIGQKLMDSFGLSALQKDILGAIANGGINETALRRELEKRMERVKDIGKTVLEQKLKEALNNNKLYQNAMKVQSQVRELVTNPTGAVDRYVENATTIATNKMNQELDRVTTKINDKINDKYNQVIGSKVDQANAKIRQKMDEINEKLARSGATTRLTEDDIRTLLIETPKVNANIKDLYKGQF